MYKIIIFVGKEIIKLNPVKTLAVLFPKPDTYGYELCKRK